MYRQDINREGTSVFQKSNKKRRQADTPWNCRLKSQGDTWFRGKINGRKRLRL